MAALHVRALKHLFAHGPFLSADRLEINLWRGRSAHTLAGLKRQKENTTERIPEQIIRPLLQAAVFYVQTASGDILASQQEVLDLQAALTPASQHAPGHACHQLQRFIEELRATGRGVPAQPVRWARNFAPTPVIDGVVQRPNVKLAALLAGVRANETMRQILVEAAAELGMNAVACAPDVDVACDWQPLA